MANVLMMKILHVSDLIVKMIFPLYCLNHTTSVPKYKRFGVQVKPPKLLIFRNGVSTSDFLD
jgi:hypothetical protein